MESLFEKAISYAPTDQKETEADTFLALAIAHTVFGIKMKKNRPEIENDVKLADAFNQFYEKGAEQNSETAENVLNVLADRNGFEHPKLFVETANSFFDNYIASSNCKNEVKICNKKTFLEQKYYGQNYGMMSKSLIHESQHLKQFYFMKEFLTGNENVDIKYKIMAFQQIFEFCGITLPFWDVFKNDKYFFNSMEIDARKTSSDVVFQLIQNPNINKDAKKQLVSFACFELENSAELFESGTKLLKQLDWQIKKFEKTFDGSPLAEDILKNCHKLAPEIYLYAKELDASGNNLSYNVLRLKKQHYHSATKQTTLDF